MRLVWRATALAPPRSPGGRRLAAPRTAPSERRPRGRRPRTGRVHLSCAQRILPAMAVPARIVTTHSMGEAAGRVRRLYRAVLREIPVILRTYALEQTPGEVREAVRHAFRKNQSTDPRVIDLLVFRGENELYETQMHWKQKTHVLRYFAKKDQRVRKPDHSEFMESFYSNAL